MRIDNIYGPTEATVYATKGEITKGLGDHAVIGKPLKNYKIYIFDKENRLVPVGVPGELCIGGKSVARGYLNRSDLNEEKFIANPYLLEEKIYKTGDIARWMPDGNLEFLGRMDHQVKVRGYRIEPGEIASQLLKHHVVKEAVVLARKDEEGQAYLAAYFTASGQWTIEEIRNHLASTLPEYMIPSYYIELQSIPVTANGKVNRHALPEPKKSRKKSQRYKAPSNKMEEILLTIWKSVLKVEEIGVHDRFFEIGGHSLKATMLVSQIRNKMGYDFPLKEVFKQTTVKEMVDYMNRHNRLWKNNEITSVRNSTNLYPVAPYQEHAYHFSQDNISWNIPIICWILGKLETDKLNQCFQSLVDRHEVLRTTFEVPNGGGVFQRIHSEINFSMNCVQIKEDEVKEYVDKFVQPFDLSIAPLLRAQLLKVGPEKHLLMLDMHHIISDGTSVSILFKELFDLYQNEELKEIKIQYKDYLMWKEEQKEFGAYKEQESFWLKNLAGEIPRLQLPTDYYWKTDDLLGGDHLTFELDEEIRESIKDIAVRYEVTDFMILLAVYNVLLFKYTNQEDLIVGTYVSGRSHQEIENVLGLFINSLPIRNYPRENYSFVEFLLSVKSQVLDSFENQDYSYEEMIEKVLGANSSRKTLFDTMFVLQNFDRPTYQNQDLKVISYDDYDFKISEFDLYFSVVEVKNKFIFEVNYKTSLFRKRTIIQMVNDYKEIIKSIIGNSHILLSEVR